MYQSRQRLWQDYYRHDEDDTAMMNDKLNRQVNTANVDRLNITTSNLRKAMTDVGVRIKLISKCPRRPVFCTQAFIVLLI
jgi:hypothetical protein